MPWLHLPRPGNSARFDIPQISSRIYPAGYAAADFDSDGLAELLVIPNVSDSNDLWVMKYNIAAGKWQHMSPIPNHPFEADINCSGVPGFAFPVKFSALGDFDGDGRDELVVGPQLGPQVEDDRGNDLWVMKYVGTFPEGIWQHMAPIPNHPFDADIDCSGVQFPAKFAFAGDFDGDGRHELVVVPDADGSRGNDLWVMKYVGTFPEGIWQHMAPIPNHPMDADIDCSGVQFPAKFAFAGDFDGDGRHELVIVPDADGSRGNDLWVMKYVGTFPEGIWQHMAPIPNHQMDADIDCSGVQFPAKGTVWGDFDGDGRAELAIVPDADGSRGNDLWVMKYVGTFPEGIWQHMAPIPNHPMDADIDCSGVQFPARFWWPADFDGDGRHEVLVGPKADGSRGNDLWVMKYVGTFPEGIWQHMAPIPNHPMDADIDCSGSQFPLKFMSTGDFDRDGAEELVVGPDNNQQVTRAAPYFLWAMKYFGTFPSGAFGHMSPVGESDGDIILSDFFPAYSCERGQFDGQGFELVVAPDLNPQSQPSGTHFWTLVFDSPPHPLHDPVEVRYRRRSNSQGTVSCGAVIEGALMERRSAASPARCGTRRRV